MCGVPFHVCIDFKLAIVATKGSIVN